MTIKTEIHLIYQGKSPGTDYDVHVPAGVKRVEILFDVNDPIASTVEYKNFMSAVNALRLLNEPAVVEATSEQIEKIMASHGIKRTA